MSHSSRDLAADRLVLGNIIEFVAEIWLTDRRKSASSFANGQSLELYDAVLGKDNAPNTTLRVVADCREFSFD